MSNTTTERPAQRRFRYKDAAALQREIASLKLDIPWEDDTSPLLTPLAVEDRRLPNRLAVQPMEGFDSEPDGAPGELAFRRYQRYAAGGCGLIWFEATAVVAEGRSNPHQLFLHSGSLPHFEQLVTATRRSATETFGSDHNPVLVLQLTHSGRWSRPDGKRRPRIAHHNPELDQLAGVDPSRSMITDRELDRLQSAFVDAATLAASAGFDGVDIKACHGYVVSELLAAFTREGKYGGVFENRARFLVETVRRVREAVPALFVTTRINAYDGQPFPYGFGADREDPEKPDLTEPRQLLGELHAAACPIVNVSMGVPYWRPHLGRPFNRPAPGTPSTPEHPLVGVARFLTVTRELQHAQPDLPLVGTGYSWLRHFFPNVGAAAVGAGDVSVVGVGRMAFAYPDFARDLADHGRLDPRKTCFACSGCTELMRGGGPTGCILRDRDVYKLPARKRARKGR